MRIRLTVLAIVLTTAATSRAQLSPHQLSRLKTVSSVAVSPDGDRVAYTVVVPRDPFEEKDGPAWTELHVLGRNGESRPFVSGQVNVSQIAWTPEGDAITFLATRQGDEHRSLYLVPLGGGEARKLLEHTTNVESYAWAPDGDRVAFLAAEPVSEEDEELEEKGFDAIVYEEEWRPVRVWMARPEAEESPRLLEHEGSASTLRFSPAGDRLAVALAPTALVDDALVARRLRVLDAAEGTVLARIDNPGKLGDVAFSPDGRRLAYVSAADPNDPAAGRLMLVDVDGGEPRDLLPDYDEGHVGAIAWRDETTLTFLMSEGAHTFHGSIGVDGTGLAKLVAEDEAIYESASLSEDGSTVAYVAESPRHPAEVYLARDGAEPRRATHTNPWLEDVRLAEQEVVAFQARDGLTLQGILIRPLDEEPGRRYPLILTVHGGPESHYTDGWLTSYSSPGQVAAARGFAVFYPNYRGSTGRGVSFSKHGHAAAAGPEFDDLVDAVDHLIGTGLVDRDRVGITGGSYGGYASAWGATYYTERFAAAVMFVGISNLVSKVGTTDIPEEMFLVHHRKWLYDDWQYFLERSPIYYAEQARTPILILAGEEDPRVHPSQSLELYRHLEELGKAPTRLVLYPGEEHGNRRAASRLDYNLRMLRWMEHYLKGPGGDPPPYRIDYRESETAGSRTSEY